MKAKLILTGLFIVLWVFIFLSVSGPDSRPGYKSDGRKSGVLPINDSDTSKSFAKAVNREWEEQLKDSQKMSAQIELQRSLRRDAAESKRLAEESKRLEEESKELVKQAAELKAQLASIPAVQVPKIITPDTIPAPVPVPSVSKSTQIAAAFAARVAATAASARESQGRYEEQRYADLVAQQRHEEQMAELREIQQQAYMDRLQREREAFAERARQFEEEGLRQFERNRR